MHFDIFGGRNVTHKVSNQTTLYCATSNNLCFCTIWQNGKTRKSHFSLKCCISALPQCNQSLLDFFKLSDSRLTLTLLYDSLNLVINAFSSAMLGGMVQEKGVESAAAVALCCTHNACAPMHCFPERKLSSVMWFIASSIC